MGQQMVTVKGLDNWFQKKGDELADRLGSLGVDPERMTKLALLSVQGNPKLMECTPASIFVALMEAAALKLEPTLGHAYLVPYGKTARCQIGYRGMIELAQRSGLVGAVHADVIYEKDEYDVQGGSAPHIHHVPFTPMLGVDPLNAPDSIFEDENLSRGQRVMFYAVVHLLNGGPPAQDIMSILDVEKIRRRAQSYKASTSPWLTDYDAMGQKTVLRRTLWRRVSLSPELSAAIQMDESPEYGKPQRLYEVDAKFSGLRDVAEAVGEAQEQDEDDAPQKSAADDLVGRVQGGR